MNKGYTRKKILDKSIDLFAELGFSKASIRDLVRAVGVTNSTVYVHFKNKDEILYSIIENIAAVLRAELDGAIEKHDAEPGSVCAMLKSFLSGAKVVFPLDMLDFSDISPFQEKVLRMEHRVPYGRVTTYGRLAERIGKSGAARAVGNMLARNPFPLIIPCHRAIRSNGTLGGFQGGLALKRSLLEMEGICFSTTGRVLKRHFL